MIEYPQSSGLQNNSGMSQGNYSQSFSATGNTGGMREVDTINKGKNVINSTGGPMVNIAHFHEFSGTTFALGSWITEEISTRTIPGIDDSVSQSFLINSFNEHSDSHDDHSDSYNDHSVERNSQDTFIPASPPPLRRSDRIRKPPASLEDFYTFHSTGDNVLRLAVIDTMFIEHLIRLLQLPVSDITEEVVTAVLNVISGGIGHGIPGLDGFVKPLCNLLECNDPRIVIVCLEALVRICESSEVEKCYNSFAKLVDDAGGLDKVKAMQSHENREIRERALKVWEPLYSEALTVWKYFEKMGGTFVFNVKR
ncbi:OLC1v1003129C1 [Oldenlandia corymbosa var. corymbosa]|uniref:OLC1v1003129C1 n=1 Tax=Oldenlandia corymbosa var. corymbosa TaxID=529605 RepID=A0AAV1D9E0_OLDCO|nr:OLC1v1003129C1 [Oldenlandia corymbosa var. corymbosa]